MKLSGVSFLTVEQVERLHELAIQDSGGFPGLRDPGMLASAVASPQTSAFGSLAYPSLAQMAAVLAWSLARNHAFVDGNKRVAAASVIAFLELNGYGVILDDPSWEPTFLNLAAGLVTKGDLAEMLAREMGEDEEIEDG